MRAPSLLLVLAGCPYLFEPPDLSNVAGQETGSVDGDADTDTDADADTDTDTDTAVETGTTETGGDTGELEDEPAVVAFEVVPRIGEKVFHFTVDDAEGDLAGGQIELTNGTDTYVLNIPDDIDVWDPAGSTHTVGLPEYFDCLADFDEDWTLQVTDAAGNPSAPAPFHLHVEALGALPEVGNMWGQDNHLVPDPPPWVACVVYDTEPIRFDLEAIVALPPETRDYIAVIDPQPTIDIDLWVYYWPLVDANKDTFADEITVSNAVGDVTEEVSFAATAGDDVLIQALWWFAQPSDYPPYQATVFFTPE